MSFVSKGGGVTTLSALTIDADKNWAGMGISNLKELALGMVQGDLIVRGGGGILIRLPPGVANTVLTSGGAGVVPTWAPGGTYLNRYFPVTIYQLLATAVMVAPDRSNNENAALSTVYVADYGDLPASYLSATLADIDAVDAETVLAAADQNNNENVPVASLYDLIQVLEGAVADDGGALTTETAAAKNATINDMTLLPAVPVANDAYYFGSDYMFDELILNIGTAGNGVWTITWEYYDIDTTWHALAGVTDGTSGFTAAAGNHSVTFTRPASWATVAVNGVTCYWIRGRVSAYTSIVTQPKGTQSWYKIIT